MKCIKSNTNTNLCQTVSMGCTTAGETGMLSGHWSPPHIPSLAGYMYSIVNVRYRWFGLIC